VREDLEASLRGLKFEEREGGMGDREAVVYLTVNRVRLRGLEGGKKA
jgi:hypothetical protein